MDPVTLLIKGLPRTVNLDDLGIWMHQKFSREGIETFSLRYLLNSKESLAQIAADFESGFDAMIAQDIIDGKIYTQLHETYTIKAKVTRAVSEPWHSNGSSGSSVHNIQELLKKQALIIKTEQELQKKKKKLEKLRKKVLEADLKNIQHDTISNNLKLKQTKKLIKDEKDSSDTSTVEISSDLSNTDLQNVASHSNKSRLANGILKSVVTKCKSSSRSNSRQRSRSAAKSTHDDIIVSISDSDSEKIVILEKSATDVYEHQSKSTRNPSPTGAKSEANKFTLRSRSRSRSERKRYSVDDKNYSKTRSRSRSRSRSKRKRYSVDDKNNSKKSLRSRSHSRSETKGHSINDKKYSLEISRYRSRSRSKRRRYSIDDKNYSIKRSKFRSRSRSQRKRSIDDMIHSKHERSKYSPPETKRQSSKYSIKSHKSYYSRNSRNGQNRSRSKRDHSRSVSRHRRKNSSARSKPKDQKRMLCQSVSSFNNVKIKTEIVIREENNEDTIDFNEPFDNSVSSVEAIKVEKKVNATNPLVKEEGIESPKSSINSVKVTGEKCEASDNHSDTNKSNFRDNLCDVAINCQTDNVNTNLDINNDNTHADIIFLKKSAHAFILAKLNISFEKLSQETNLSYENKQKIINILEKKVSKRLDSLHLDVSMSEMEIFDLYRKHYKKDEDEMLIQEMLKCHTTMDNGEIEKVLDTLPESKMWFIINETLQDLPQDLLEGGQQ